MAVLIDWLASGWKYKVVSAGAEPTFYTDTYDDSGWSTGQAAFGTAGDPDLLHYSDINTPWSHLGDLLLRRRFYGSSPFTVYGRVDDNMTVYIDEANLGVLSIDLSSAPHSVRDTNPDSLSSYAGGTNHLLAVRVQQYTGNPNSYTNPQYFDLRLEGVAISGVESLRIRQRVR